MVSATTAEDTKTKESEQNELSIFLLNMGEKDKETIFEQIEDLNISDDEKNRLKEGMLDSWENYPDNTNQDYLVAEEVLNLLIMTMIVTSLTL